MNRIYIFYLKESNVWDIYEQHVLMYGQVHSLRDVQIFDIAVVIRFLLGSLLTHDPRLEMGIQTF